MNEDSFVKVQASDKVIIGKPAKGISSELFASAEKALLELDYVIEAHLPQYFVLNKMQLPRLVFVLVVSGLAKQEETVTKLNEIRSEGVFDAAVLDFWVMNSDDPLLPAIRRAQCRVVKAA